MQADVEEQGGKVNTAFEYSDPANQQPNEKVVKLQTHKITNEIGNVLKS